jgi:hypothetical protein
MVLGDRWDRDQLMGLKPVEGITLDPNARGTDGAVLPQYWGIPGYLTAQEADCYVSRMQLRCLYGVDTVVEREVEVYGSSWASSCSQTCEPLEVESCITVDSAPHRASFFSRFHSNRNDFSNGWSKRARIPSFGRLSMHLEKKKASVGVSVDGYELESLFTMM